MPDKPITHGWDHRPGGFDPSQAGPWHYVATSGTSWNGGTHYVVGNIVAHDVYLYICTVPNTNVEPNVNPAWHTNWNIDVPLFQNGWTNIAPGVIPNPTPMGYRISVGALNQLDRNNGSIAWYGEHQVEIAGDVTGGSSGTAVFYLPPAYRLPYDKPVPGHDSSMNYVASRLYSSGAFVRGIA